MVLDELIQKFEQKEKKHKLMKEIFQLAQIKSEQKALEIEAQQKMKRPLLNQEIV